LIFTWAAADYFGANIVQHIGVVLNGLCALIGDRAGMGKALLERGYLLRAAGEARCQEGDNDRCVVIGEARHSGRCSMTQYFSSMEKSAAEYSGRQWNRPSQI
jgi:hypothetical protein